MTRLVLALSAAAALAGCATTGTEAAADRPMTCDAVGAQSFVGQRASADVGAAILKGSGARTLRWGPPRSAWTMDYRQDRVNVRYDDAMMIEAVTCG